MPLPPRNKTSSTTRMPYEGLIFWGWNFRCALKFPLCSQDLSTQPQILQERGSAPLPLAVWRAQFVFFFTRNFQKLETYLNKQANTVLEMIILTLENVFHKLECHGKIITQNLNPQVILAKTYEYEKTWLWF